MQNAKTPLNQSTASHSKRTAKGLSSFILLFSIAIAVFFLGPPFLGYAFPPYPLMKVADVLDLLTPLVLIPLYWLLFRLDGSQPPSLKENLSFLVLAAFWVSGQGMHLAANSIGHLVENMTGTEVYKLTNFYDEVLSHYLWHFGVIGLSAILLYRQWKAPLTEGMVTIWNTLPAAIIYGFTYFALVIEGATVPMGLPFAVLVVIFGLVRGRSKLKQQPLLSFFLTAYIVALVLFTIWGIWQGGLPEFSKVGLI